MALEGDIIDTDAMEELAKKLSAIVGADRAGYTETAALMRRNLTKPWDGEKAAHDMAVEGTYLTSDQEQS